MTVDGSNLLDERLSVASTRHFSDDHDD